MRLPFLEPLEHTHARNIRCSYLSSHVRAKELPCRHISRASWVWLKLALGKQVLSERQPRLADIETPLNPHRHILCHKRLPLAGPWN